VGDLEIPDVTLGLLAILLKYSKGPWFEIRKQGIDSVTFMFIIPHISSMRTSQWYLKSRVEAFLQYPSKLIPYAIIRDTYSVYNVQYKK
jgi:hypothetical protein